MWVAASRVDKPYVFIFYEIINYVQWRRQMWSKDNDDAKAEQDEQESRETCLLQPTILLVSRRCYSHNPSIITSIREQSLHQGNINMAGDTRASRKDEKTCGYWHGWFVTMMLLLSHTYRLKASCRNLLLGFEGEIKMDSIYDIEEE